MMGDIAILAALAVGGYWFLNNYKSLGIGGGGGGSTVPPVEGGVVPPLEGEPAPTGPTTSTGNPAGDQNIRAEFEKAHGISTNAECAAGNYVKTSNHKCVKAGANTALIFEAQDGRKCISSQCGRDASEANKKKYKINDCKCTFPAAAATASAYVYIAHYVARIKPQRILNNTVDQGE